MNDILVLENKEDIAYTFNLLRRSAMGYWNFFTFSLGYCIIFPMIKKISRNSKPFLFDKIVMTVMLSYFFYAWSIKRIVSTFNKEDYERFRTFCLKYQLEDNVLL